MRFRTSSWTARTTWLGGAALLIAIGLDLVAAGNALALKREDVISQLVNCNAGCDSDQTTCNGGCFAVTLPGDRPATIWFDSLDRGAAPPTALMETAIDECRREGGHLPTERDMAEAVRAGLPNGTNNWLMTSDLAMTNYHVVRWTGVDAAFDDQYSTYMSWSGPTTPYDYRCMWTNELR